MNIFCFTNKGANSKINTDTILYNSEAISGNPLIINEQNNSDSGCNSDSRNLCLHRLATPED